MKRGLLILSTILLSLTSCGQSMVSSSNSLSERIDEESSYSFYTKDKYLAFLVEATGIEVGKDDRIEILYFKQCENGKFYKFYFNKNDVDTIEVVADVYAGKEKLLELNNPSYRAVFIKNDGTCVYPTRTEDSFKCSFEEGLFLEEEIRDIQNSFGIVSPFTLSAEERLIKAANIELEDSREVVLYCNVECQKGWFYIYRIEPVTGGLSVIVEVYLNENSILTFPDSTYRVAYVGYDMKSLYMGKGSKYVLPPDYITDEEAALIKEQYRNKLYEEATKMY